VSQRDWRMAVDIGGTFTDLVLLDAASGQVVVEKVLTTPKAPLDAVRAGVRQLLTKAGVRPAEIVAPIVHATTLITNALIEGKIGRAAVVTTAGFGDTLLIRDEHRYDMYDLQIEFPAPPVPRELVVELPERTSATGTVISAPAAADLDAVAEQLRAAGVESACASSTATSTRPTSVPSPSTCGARSACRSAPPATSPHRSASTRG
jgi:N-methylhydantoinase A